MARSTLVVVVSLPKSGTHLIGELMAAFGYQVYGPSQAGGFGKLPSETLLAQMMEDPGSLPPNTCLIVHELPLPSVPGQLAVSWQQTGLPTVLLNFRDPRDVVCSSVRFATGKTFSGWVAPLAHWQVHSAILKALPDRDARLLHAIRNSTYPYWNVFRESSWLLHHPMVCKVRFEDLVGSAGGGRRANQRRVVAEAMAHVGIEGDPEIYAQSIYREDSPTFSKGKTNAWRREFNEQHHREFNRLFGDVLEDYGYERYHPASVEDLSRSAS